MQLLLLVPDSFFIIIIIYLFCVWFDSISEQDEELEKLAETIGNTSHIAWAINEEFRLLEGLDVSYLHFFHILILNCFILLFIEIHHSHFELFFY